MSRSSAASCLVFEDEEESVVVVVAAAVAAAAAAMVVVDGMAGVCPSWDRRGGGGWVERILWRILWRIDCGLKAGLSCCFVLVDVDEEEDAASYAVHIYDLSQS